jgi:hypothetical protein
MTSSRHHFKMTPSNESFFLYPWPVIKEKKYLIQVPNEKVAAFLIYAIEKHWLPSPDDQTEWLVSLGLHQDQRTVIYQINFTAIHLVFLPHRQTDLEKAQSIEKLLSKKIFNYLLSSIPLSDLEKTIHNQLQCSSCQSFGIDSLVQELKSYLKV